jgi:eukaryotic-like serine/threonine-protein kinase
LTLTPGSRLGVYEVAAQIGEGGMGQVFRATDTRLKRQVAIKILPPAVAADHDRLARFQREAELLASLNHPHIAGIYGLEESDGVSALVMELVEGEDLSQRIARGAIPIDEALPIAKQIAEALEAAHEQGIIHRDLKPANIKVRADGMVKVLDFGLAKALDPAASSSPEAMNSPTISVRGTLMGLIIGTAAYMAPEQARGKIVDRRADIWAFGVVLYEMLSGRRAFDGEDVSTILASVIKEEVSWPALPADLPEPIRRLLHRCLEKDPRRRLRDIGEARLTLEDPTSSEPKAHARPPAASAIAAPASLWRRALPIAATALVAGVAASILTWSFQPTTAKAATVVTRFPIVLPDGQVATRQNVAVVAISPDGARLAYAANRQLYVRSMADVEAKPIPGSNVDAASPFFSPDGQWVGFFSYGDSLLRKIPIGGGSPVTLCKIDAPWSATWDGDTIFVASGTHGIMRVSANGGEPEVVVKINPGEAADGPQLLDDGRLLFALTTGSGANRWDEAQIIVQSMASGERHIVMRGGSAARYLATAPESPGGVGGHLVYAVGNSLVAVPFDATRLELRGAPMSIVEPVTRSANTALQSSVAQYAVSATGTLAYLPGRSSGASLPKALALAGRDGALQMLGLPQQPYIHPRLSPDGRQLAVGTDDGKDANVWVYDLKSGGSLRRLTFGGRNEYPIWTRDGRFITFQSDRDGDKAVFSQPADGSGAAQRLSRPEAGVAHRPESWSSDGKTLSMNVVNAGNESVWTITTDSGTKPAAFADSPAVEKHSTFSPDGRWVAYMATTEGDSDIYVQPFPPTGAKYQVSTGGRTPAWSPDGKQLFFHAIGLNRFVVVDIRTEHGLTVGLPVPLPIDDAIHPLAQRNYDVTPDGKQLLIVLPAQAQTAAGRRGTAQINMVLNWFEELQTRAPHAR